jgi:hypothetical protein
LLSSSGLSISSSFSAFAARQFFNSIEPLLSQASSAFLKWQPIRFLSMTEKRRADTNVWVLVLDDASQNYGPPGSPARRTIQQIGGNQLRLSYLLDIDDEFFVFEKQPKIGK